MEVTYPQTAVCIGLRDVLDRELSRGRRCGQKAGKQVAATIRTAVGGEPFETPDGRHFTLTISIGVAAFPEDGRDADVLLAATDQALYRAKSRGRNGFVATDDLGPHA